MDLEFYRVVPSLGPHFFPGHGAEQLCFLFDRGEHHGFFPGGSLELLLSGADPQQGRGTQSAPRRLQPVGAVSLQAHRPERAQRSNHGRRGGAGDLFQPHGGRNGGIRLEDVYQKEIGESFRGFLDLSRSAGRALEQGWEKLRFSRWETKFEKRGGASLTLGFSGSPLKDSEGQEIGGVLIFQDLTQLREMEEELKRRERLSALGAWPPAWPMKSAIRLLQSADPSKS